MQRTDEKLLDRISAGILSVLSPNGKEVLLHAPYFPPKATELVQDCLETGWVSSAGSYVTEFEELLARTCGRKHAIAVVNGTTALQTCFRLAGVCDGDEVLVPTLSFVATANAVVHAGGVPHFVDVSRRDFGMCPTALTETLNKSVLQKDGKCFNRNTGARISAVCPVHCLGHPCEISAISDICEHYGLTLIVDAAEALGSNFHGKPAAGYGALSALSFNGNKTITTGGGGAILTDDDNLAQRARHLTTTAKIPHRWESLHDEVAWNFRMPNLNAALGLAQLQVLDKILSSKRLLHSRYRQAFEGIEGCELLSEPDGCTSNFWLNCLMLTRGNRDMRDSLLERMSNRSIQCRPLWTPLHRLPMFEQCPRGQIVVAEELYEKCVLIPSSPNLIPISRTD